MIMEGVFYIGPIMAIKSNDRLDSAPEVKEILTRHGHNIKTRAGFMMLVKTSAQWMG